MRGRIVGAVVRLDLDDATGALAVHEDLVEEVRRHAQRSRLEVVPFHRLTLAQRRRRRHTKGRQGQATIS